MFIPVIDEKDIYDNAGRQVNDINTTFELIDQLVLGHKDVVPQDEDDDQAHYFTGSSTSYYIFSQPQAVCERKAVVTDRANVAYPLLPERKPLNMAYDILTPPPENTGC